MLEGDWDPFLFWTPISTDFHCELWVLNPHYFIQTIKKYTVYLVLRNGIMCTFREKSMYKPAFVMESTASPSRDKTLCKGTEGAGGTAVFPEEKDGQSQHVESEIFLFHKFLLFFFF